MGLIQQLREAAGKLNPAEIRASAERRIAIQLRASSESTYAAMFEFLLPAVLSAEKRRRLAAVIHLEGEASAPANFDLTIVEHGGRASAGDFFFVRGSEDTLVREILAEREDLALPLARCFPAFRGEFVRRTIHKIATENALFSLATSLPNIAPLVGLAWALGEFATDTAFLTVNQLRLVFLLGAASDRPVGFTEQKTEIASIVAGAFGWRAVARELAGKIPMGGGVIPKAAIAYAGTYVVGASVERLYRVGYGYTRAERKAAYQDAFSKGKEVAAAMLERWRQR